MLAHEMMSDVVPALKLTDSAYKALNWMEVFRLSHLPVVEGGHFIGIISDEAIYDSGIFNESIETISDRFENYSVTRCRHIFEIINLCNTYSLTSIAVIDDDKKYLGLIVLPTLVSCFSQLINTESTGGLIVIEVQVNNYSLSQIAQIVESNGGKILSMYVSPKPETTLISVTLKLNTTEITSIIRTFERYEYEIKATFEEHDTMKEIIQDNYNSLMRYLNT